MNALDLSMTHHVYPTLNEVSRWAALHAVDEMLESPTVQRLCGGGWASGLGKRGLVGRRRAERGHPRSMIES